MKLHQRKLWLVVLTVALAAAGCAPRPASTGSATATNAPRYPLNLASGGLERLNSYQAKITVDFNGQRHGQTSAGHVESLTEIDRRGAALRQTQSVTATIPNRKFNANHTEFLKVGQKIFVKQDDESFGFEAGPNQPVSPAEFGLLALESLVALPPSVPIAPKFTTQNGLNVQQYHFSEQDLAGQKLTFTRAEGEVWVATPGNYVTQYEISGTLKAAAPTAAEHLLDEGQLRLSYRLDKVNQPLELALPAATAAVTPTLAALPRLPNAQVTAAYPALIEYRSVISPVSATLYYRQAMPPLGWTEELASVFNEKARLVFTQNNRRVLIFITPLDEPGQIKVVVNLEERR